MPLEKVTRVAGKGVFVPGNDIDTDRIIPARYLRCVTFDGLGEFAFYDERKNEDGTDKPHPLNNSQHRDAVILLSGANFGCGSSREHAPQSLYRWGIRAILAESFGEIFFGNSIKIGMPCLTLSGNELIKLADAIKDNFELSIEVDVKNARVSYDDYSIQAELPDSARQSLVEGRWDPMAELLESAEEVEHVANSLPYFKT